MPLKNLMLPILAILGLTEIAFSAPDLEMEKKRQCRSVHLSYEMGESLALYTEVVVQKSAPGTYFCAMGFNSGYLGMQELSNGKKIIVFSVWDKSNTDDKNAVDESKRARVLETGEGVRTGRFGGEGTGVQSFYDYDWKVGEAVRFLVQAKQVIVDGVAYTDFKGWLYDGKRKQWQSMTTLRTPTPKKRIYLRGGYGFVEDFRRNYKSAKIIRRARFQNTWSLGLDEKWTPLTKARFTGDRNPATNVDAGKDGDGFFLQTGGATEMKTNKLWSWMQGDVRKGKLPKSVLPLIGSEKK